jgi:hypothetical protein
MGTEMRLTSHPVGMSRRGRRAATLAGPTYRWGEAHMNGWLMWGLILPLLLVVAGIVVLLRKRNGPR